MSKIDYAAEKWARKAKAGLRRAAENIRRPESFDAYVRGIANASGISESTVRSSIPAQEWQKFSQNPDEAFRMAEQAIDAAAASGKWKRNYLHAFGG